MDFIIIPLIIALGFDGKNSSAAIHATQAYVKQSGIERTLQEFQERELSETLRARLGNVAWLSKTISEQKVTFEWRF